MVTGLTFAGRTGTMTRTAGLTAVTVQLAPSAYDDRIATWAKVVSPSGVAPAARVGSGAAAARVLYTGNGTLSEWVTLDSIGGGLSRSDVTVGNGLEKTDLTGQSFRLDPDFSFSNVVQTFSISDRMIIGDSTGGTYAPAIASFGFLRRYFESEIQDEGVRLGGEDPSTIVNYTGAGVTGTRSGTTITIDVPGTVSSDGTLTGIGSTASPLSVSAPFNISGLSTAAWAAGDSIPFNDVNGNNNRRALVSSLVTFLGGSGIVATAAGDGLNLDVNAITGSGTVLADADLIPIYDNSTTATIKVPATAISNYVMAAGGSDGVVSGGGFAYPNLTLARTVGANVVIPINTDLRIATWARVNGASGTVPDTRIPSAIARDTELPASGELVPSGGTDGQLLSKDSDTDYDTIWINAPSGGGGGGADLSDDTPVAMTPDLSGASGTDSNASRSDHAHAVAAGTAVALGTSHSEGTSTSFARADHVHGSLATVAPDEITPGQSGNVGSGTAVARATHHHSAPVGTPVSVSTANNAGNAASFSRSDHIHLGDGTANSLDATLSGDDLTITVGRTVGNDLTDTVTLPTGSGAITFTRVGVGSVDLTNQIAVPQSFNLSDPIEDGELIEFRVSSGTGAARIVLGHFLITGQELLALPAQAGTPASLNGSLAIKTAIQGVTTLTSFGHSSVYIWRADTDTLWARNPRQKPVTVEVSELQLTGGGGGGGGGSDDGVADSITTAFSGTTLTTTIGRSGTLADLSDTATIPAFDLHDDVSDRAHNDLTDRQVPCGGGVRDGRSEPLLDVRHAGNGHQASRFRREHVAD